MFAALFVPEKTTPEPERCAACDKQPQSAYNSSRENMNARALRRPDRPHRQFSMQRREKSISSQIAAAMPNVYVSVQRSAQSREEL